MRIILRHRRYYSIDRHVDVAIDVTYIAYYGGRDEFQISVGAPSNKSYSWCYEIATISIVGKEVKFTLGMRPLCRRIPYMPRAVLMEQLLDIASENVSIGTVYVDAGFDSIGVMHAVEEAGFSYLIRKSSDDRVDRFVDDIDGENHPRGEGGGHPDVGRGSLGPQGGCDGDVRDESVSK